jgi:hypothetical protein
MRRVPAGLVNLRDLGVDGPLRVPGVLLRSDAPLSGDVEPEGTPWPPRTVIDLRGAAERNEPHPLATVAEVIDLPLLGGGPRRGPRRWPDRLEELYLGLLRAPGAERLVQAIGHIADAEPPVLVHCTAGKDRTGVTIALALTLVGVEAEAVVDDYLRTAAAMPDVLARMQSTVRVATEGTSLAVPPPHIAQAPQEAILGLLEAFEAHPGGVTGWYLAHGGDEATLDRLRARLIESPLHGRTHCSGE